MLPTARSLKLLRERGYRAEVVEKRLPIPGKYVTRDLFNIGDILAIRAGEVLLVQTTSGSNVAARIAKIAAADATPDVRAAGIAIHVHGWRKLKAGWECREVNLS